MHHSRLFGIFIDTPVAQAGSAASFWSAALGVPARPVAGEEQFTALDGALPGLTVDIQAVDDAPRYHVDIETDDVEAEVARRSPALRGTCAQRSRDVSQARPNLAVSRSAVTAQ